VRSFTRAVAPQDARTVVRPPARLATGKEIGIADNQNPGIWVTLTVLG
jgi:hypothetical protein